MLEEGSPISLQNNCTNIGRTIVPSRVTRNPSEAKSQSKSARSGNCVAHEASRGPRASLSTWPPGYKSKVSSTRERPRVKHTFPLRPGNGTVARKYAPSPPLVYDTTRFYEGNIREKGGKGVVVATARTPRNSMARNSTHWPAKARGNYVYIHRGRRANSVCLPCSKTRDQSILASVVTRFPSREEVPGFETREKSRRWLIKRWWSMILGEGFKGELILSNGWM